MISIEKSLKELRNGNDRFISGKTVHVESTRGFDPQHAEGQRPFATILACSDSRVPVELIFDQGFGDLFVIRIAGNVVAPSQVGSVEFAASVLGAKLVVVLGHSNCGAVATALDELEKEPSVRSPNLRAIVDRVRPAIEGLTTIEEAVTANVRRSVNQLLHGSSIIESLIQAKELKIVGAEYSIETGAVTFQESD